MEGHPAYANKRAMEAAGADPGEGQWPGDPGYTGPIAETGDGRPIYGFKDGHPVFEPPNYGYGSEELNALAATARAVRRFLDRAFTEPVFTNPIDEVLSHPEEADDEPCGCFEPETFGPDCPKHRGDPEPELTDRELTLAVLRTATAFNEAAHQAQKAGLTVEVDTVKVYVVGPIPDAFVLDIRVLRDLTTAAEGDDAS